jgi:hypothetical protein
MNVQALRNKLERQKGKRDQIESSLLSLQEGLQEKKRSLRKCQEAKEIIRIVGLMTQEQLQYHISDIASLALESVFPDPYELKVEFVIRRNKTECDLFFVRDKMKIEPKDAAGVGAMDVASFALRISSWNMMNPHTRNTIILDEPFKYLKGQEANLAVLKMVNTISKKLKIQIIMISDERISREDIIDNSDKAFEVRKIKGKSKIIEI